MPLARQLRPLVRVALPVATAAALVALAIINIAVVKTSPADAAQAGRFGLYYPLAFVGILSLVVGASVRLRRPNDSATLHFFWLSVAFAGVLAFGASGRFDHVDYVFDWADAIARFALAPLFLHFALVFPDRPNPWVRSRAGTTMMALLYVPAFALGLRRVWVMLADASGARTSGQLDRLQMIANAYLVLCVVGGLALMVRALARHRSVTARRQLRWIMWGSTVGSLPFVLLYVMPLFFGTVPAYAEKTAVLLGCIPLAFASAIVRYRLMDVEVIIKKGLVVAAASLLLLGIYVGTLDLVRLVFKQEEGSSWALLATLVVAVVAPRLWNAIQAGLDRLYYKDRYDYRKALLHFARELNSELDLGRLSQRLVSRVGETLGLDRVAVFLPDPDDPNGRFVAVASEGFSGAPIPPIPRSSAMGTRLIAGHMAALEDPVHRWLSTDSRGAATDRHLDDLPELREAGLYHFVPCVAKDATMAIVGVGRRPYGEPPSSEDLALLGAVAGQAATALENARLYLQLSVKAEEIERLRQFSDSVVESLSDGLVVVDLDDRVLRWNRRAESLAHLGRGEAIGRPLSALFKKPFIDSLRSARREAPAGTTLYRVPLSFDRGGQARSLLVNLAIAPFHTEGAQAGWILVIEDITERANLEEQLQLSEKMAAIGLLAAGVAHEVNTPLTGISSFTQLLLEKTDPADPRTPILEKIESQTFRAAKIVNSLLNLARPSGGETGPVDINTVIGDILALLEHQFKLSHVQVKRDLAPVPVVVSGVEYKLQQVFLNLFLNARDAMPKGGWVSVMTSSTGPNAIVEVNDTGIGIPPEHLARIYDPFFTTKADGRGTGLGLAVTYGIVQEHGGTLSCQSDTGQGTSFRLVLPLLSRPAQAIGQ
jgi:PAS domain S-box-containing protein